jgi:hypothetical protein
LQIGDSGSMIAVNTLLIQCNDSVMHDGCLGTAKLTPTSCSIDRQRSSSAPYNYVLTRALPPFVSGLPNSTLTCCSMGTDELRACGNTSCTYSPA